MQVHALNKPLLGIMLLLASTLTSASDIGVKDLMQMLGQKKSGTATFVEKKYIAMLNQPLESSGELSFTAPDKLEKRTLRPKPEAVTMQGDKLLLERSDGRKISVSLSDRPEVSAFVESIRATLSGDRSALERYYTVSLRGSSEQWQLSLTPIQPRMQKIINLIRIGGSRAQVKNIAFFQADGDHSEMIITSSSSK